MYISFIMSNVLSQMQKASLQSLWGRLSKYSNQNDNDKVQDNTEEERKFIEKKKSVAQKKLLGINPSKGALWSRWGVFGNTSFGSTRSIQQVDAVDEWLDETNINAPPRDSTGTEIPTSNEIEEKEMEDMREKTHMIVDFKRLPPNLDQQTNGEDGFLAKIFGSVRRVSTDDGLRRSKSAGAKSQQTEPG